MNHQKKIYVSIYNSFRDRRGNSESPPPQSDKVRIGARSLRVNCLSYANYSISCFIHKHAFVKSKKLQVYLYFIIMRIWSNIIPGLRIWGLVNEINNPSAVYPLIVLIKGPRLYLDKAISILFRCVVDKTPMFKILTYNTSVFILCQVLNVF